MGPALGDGDDAGLGEGGLLALVDPGAAEERRVSAVSATSRQVPSMATSRRPPSHAPGVVSVASGAATLVKSASSGAGPSRDRAWKIADLDGRAIGSSPEAHARPSVMSESTSS